MLRILLIIVITYIVIRIALRLLLTESPSARRQRMNGGWGSRNGPFDRAGGGYGANDRFGGYGGADGFGRTRGRDQGPRRIEDIEDAEFEEIPDDTGKSGKEGK